MSDMSAVYDALRNADAAGDKEAVAKLAAFIQSQSNQPAPPPEEPSLAEQAGKFILGVPRQVGLTARYGLQSLANIADIGAEPIRQLAVNPLMRMVGGPEAQSVSQSANRLADAVGLPEPKDANERVIGQATTMLGSSMALGGGASALANRTAPGVTQNVLNLMAQRPGVQAAGAVGAGASGGAVAEAGGGPIEQFIASLVGGVGAGYGADKAINAATAIKTMLTPKPTQLTQADQTINLVLERSGIDWSQVPERIKQGMRAEVAQALNSGQPLNADALRRLLVFRQANVTPTVGQLTQDPGQITREMNLAKTGANSTDVALQRLPQLQNQNVQSLLRQLDEAGAAGAPSASEAGATVIAGLNSNINRAQTNINSLYSAARDTQGRSLPLEGGTFTARANQLLDEANLGSFLPESIVSKMNAIAGGKYPLTVDVAEQLKTSIGMLQRGTSDGNMRRALGIVRQALDETPLFSQKVNPAGLPAVPGTVPPSPTIAGQQSIEAFNAARTANREFMRRLESNPAMNAVWEGVEPDQFIQRFVVGKGASAADVQALRNELNPAAVQAMRQNLVRYLKDAATNNTDDIAKFSNSAYRSAFRSLEDKLPSFFSREEIAQLRVLGEAGKYMQAQPAGAAVNNSNSGALILGRGLDMLDSVANYIPLGGRDIIKGKIQGMQQTQVLAPKNALMLATEPRPNNLALNPLLAGTLVTKEPRKDKRGD